MKDIVKNYTTKWGKDRFRVILMQEVDVSQENVGKERN
jgi:hypothetical protein